MVLFRIMLHHSVFRGRFRIGLARVLHRGPGDWRLAPYQIKICLDTRGAAATKAPPGSATGVCVAMVLNSGSYITVLHFEPVNLVWPVTVLFWSKYSQIVSWKCLKDFHFKTLDIICIHFHQINLFKNQRGCICQFAQSSSRYKGIL